MTTRPPPQAAVPQVPGRHVPPGTARPQLTRKTQKMTGIPGELHYAANASAVPPKARTREDLAR